MMLDLVSADFSDFFATLLVPYQVLYGYKIVKIVNFEIFEFESF